MEPVDDEEVVGTQSQRSRRITSEQKMILVNYIAANMHLTTNVFRGLQGRRIIQHGWADLTSILNNVEGGAIKDAKTWQRTFIDMKAKAKSKNASILYYDAGTGGGPAPPTLSYVEAKLVEMLAPAVRDGLQVPEGGFTRPNDNIPSMASHSRVEVFLSNNEGKDTFHMFIKVPNQFMNLHVDGPEASLSHDREHDGEVVHLITPRRRRRQRGSSNKGNRRLSRNYILNYARQNTVLQERLVLVMERQNELLEGILGVMRRSKEYQ